MAVSLITLLAGCTGGNNIDATPTPAPSKSSSVSVAGTMQYSTPQEKYGRFLSDGTTMAEPTYLLPAYYTADQYIQKAFNSTYLFSGELEADSYPVSWASQKGLLGTFSVDYADSFRVLNDTARSQNSTEIFNNVIYTRGGQDTILPSCSSASSISDCVSTEYNVIKATHIYNSASDVQLEITIQLSPIYQKPDSAEGNSIVQTREYKLNFGLTYANAPESNDTEIPIMVITSITSTLDIKSTQDYIGNAS